MFKKVASYFVIFALVVISLFLVGCKKQQINFNRESQASNLINKLRYSSESPPDKSSGMIIIKDKNSSWGSSINFGPKDIDFSNPKHY